MPSLTDRVHRRTSNHCHARSVALGVPRILCVDDDPDIQTALELRMRRYAVEIDHAFYGMQGIVEAAKTHPNLIIMDLAMPRGDGEYLLDCIKGNSAIADIPVIVLTGMRNPALKNRLLNAGAELFLQKPVRFDELLHHMSRFIDIKQRDNDWEFQ